VLVCLSPDAAKEGGVILLCDSACPLCQPNMRVTFAQRKSAFTHDMFVQYGRTHQSAALGEIVGEPGGYISADRCVGVS
jgi:hypothetical protein